MNWLDERELQLHISILGWLHIIVNAFFLVLAGFAFIFLPTFGVISGDSDGAVVFGVLGTAFGLLMVVLGLPGVLAGYGLLKRKPWSRILAIVLGVLGLVNFPIGTAIGIYTLIVLLQRSASEYFLPHTPA